VITINDGYTELGPRPDRTVSIISGWSSILPPEINANAGNVPLFNDPRINWVISKFESLAGKNVLELGPLEGGHSYMALKAGANSLIAIEANQLSFIKCLIIKELLRLDKASFLFGNFLPWLQSNQRVFDLVLCCGVLYHMPDPLTLLQEIARSAGHIYIWTHYVPDDYNPENNKISRLSGSQTHNFQGKELLLYQNSYAIHGAEFCGGVYSEPVWMRRNDIFDVLNLLGFSKIEIESESLDHPAGPAIGFLASR
jgi:SAM-dependent methyltransferase